MKMTLHRLQLPLQHPFAISRGSRTVQRSLVVQLELADVCGYGEAGENAYYGHTLDSLSESLKKAEPLLESSGDPAAPDWPATLWDDLRRVLSGDRFALSALDIAAHDLSARLRSLPLFQALGLTWQQVPESSFTIGIAPIDQMIQKLKDAAGWSCYKIKLGTANDLNIVQSLRSHTAAPFRVDANGGWTAEETIARSQELALLGVEFIEQPLPVDAAAEEKRRVREQSHLPVIADEDCQVETDVDRCADLYDGVNVKLCKCGGLTPARRMLVRAKQLGLRPMVGCMIESSVGISAAAHLLPLVQYADLDGAALLREDPAEGIAVTPGPIDKPGQLGLGAQLK